MDVGKQRLEKNQRTDLENRQASNATKPQNSPPAQLQKYNQKKDQQDHQQKDQQKHQQKNQQDHQQKDQQKHQKKDQQDHQQKDQQDHQQKVQQDQQHKDQPEHQQQPEGTQASDPQNNKRLVTCLLLWKATARAHYGALGVSRKSQERMKSNLDDTLDSNIILKRALKDSRKDAETERRKNKAEIETKTRQVEELSQLLEIFRSKVESRDKENDVLLKQKEEKQKENENLQRQLLNYQAAAVKVGLHMAQLQQTMDDLRGQLRSFEAQTTALKTNVITLQQEKEALQMQVMQTGTKNEKLKEQTDTQDTYINQLTVAFQEMHRQAMMLQADADIGRHEVQTLEAQLQETWELVQSRDQSIAQLQENLEAARTRHQDLENVLRARSVDVWRYQTEVEEGRRTIRILEGKLRQQS